LLSSHQVDHDLKTSDVVALVGASAADHLDPFTGSLAAGGYRFAEYVLNQLPRPLQLASLARRHRGEGVDGDRSQELSEEIPLGADLRHKLHRLSCDHQLAETSRSVGVPSRQQTRRSRRGCARLSGR
jgi:hypothetical protein